MEQWVQDGRDTIRDRGYSRIPAHVEEDGYTIDTTGGLRGMLKKQLTSLAGSSQHVDPTVAFDFSSSAINFTKGTPQMYAECEVDYEYRFNGRIVDSNNECEALKELEAQLKKEEADEQAMRQLLGDDYTKTAHGSENQSSTLGSFDYTSSKASFATPKSLPTANRYYPLEVVVGAGQVTQAMDEALLGMHEGEVTDWWLDPAFAFRDHGLRTKFGSIPSDAPVQMRVRLLKFNNPMSSHERVLFATEMKNTANNKLQVALAAENQGGDIYEEFLQDAILQYNNVLTKLGRTFIHKPHQRQCSSEETPPEPSREEQIKMDNNLRAIVFTNLSLCWFKKNDLGRSSDYVDRALKCNPLYSKALYRRALIEERRLNFDESIALLRNILKLAEEGKIDGGVNVNDIESKIKSLEATSQKQDEVQRRRYQGIFSKTC